MSRLLCIDWDFWFYNPLDAGTFEDPNWQYFDWGHKEATFFIAGPVWDMRALTFERADVPLPQIHPPTGGWEEFWSRFTFAPPEGTVPDIGFPLAYAADSNAHAGTLTPPDDSLCFESVVLFDAHHDSGYRIPSFEAYEEQGTFSCEDWMLEHQRLGTTNLEARYPAWNPNGPSNDLPAGVLTRQRVDDGDPVDMVFDTVFVCRSGAWVPPWCDNDFEAFLDAAPFPVAWIDEMPRNRDWGVQAVEDA